MSTADTPTAQIARILNADGEFIGCPTATADRIATEVVRPLADELARLRTAFAHLSAAGVGTDADDRPKCATCGREIEDRATPSMDGSHSARWVHTPGGHAVCYPRQPSSLRATPAAPADELAFVHAVLALSGRADLAGGLLWRLDDRHVSIAVDVSDTFAWGGSDAEDVTPERLPLLEQAYTDLVAIGHSEAAYTAELYAARVRGMRPQGAAYPQRPETQALFDSCGPERPVGPGNPRTPPAAEEQLRADVPEANSHSATSSSQTGSTEAADPGRRIAYRIRAELVCCTIYDTLHERGEPAPERISLVESGGHGLCYWGEAAARIAEDASRPDPADDARPLRLARIRAVSTPHRTDAPDMDPDRWHAILSGQLRPGSLDLALIAEAYGIVPMWLITGEGDPRPGGMSPRETPGEAFLRRQRERLVAQQPTACPTECDPDCDAACHEGHAVPWKRQHPEGRCEMTTVGCSSWTFGRRHGGHAWEPQPGMAGVWCPGWRGPASDEPLTLRDGESLIHALDRDAAARDLDGPPAGSSDLEIGGGIFKVGAPAGECAADLAWGESVSAVGADITLDIRHGDHVHDAPLTRQNAAILRDMLTDTLTETETADFATETHADGREHTRVDRLTDGRVMCCVCCDYTELDGLEPHPEGGLRDVCKSCAEQERAAEMLARHAQSGADAPGCDCGHDGMGSAWHRDDCAWRLASTPTDTP